MSEQWQFILRDMDAEPQLEPVYPFTSPGESIVLHDGPVGIGAGERPGRVELIFTEKPQIRWNVEPHPHDLPEFTQAVDLTLRRGGRDWTVNAPGDALTGGWINHAEFAIPGSQLQRVVVHWVNLPDILGRGMISTESADGTGHCWNGRWRIEVDGWRLTLDRRHDYSDAITNTETTSIFVLTHVMEVQRVDGGSFDVESVKQILECLRICLSFAFGRWVAPTLPVGYDSTDQIAWEDWTSPICHRAQKIGAAWLNPIWSDDVAHLLKRALPAFLNPAQPDITRFQMVPAVLAVETGFVEQRILTIFPALENLAWVTLVLSGSVKRRDYRNTKIWPGERRLRRLLELAQIPNDIDIDVLPSLAAFATAEKLADGPAAVVAVRNRLVHPKTPNDQIYHRSGLVCDTWLLSRHYLNLLILHSIGYQGSYVKQFPGGWAGDAQPVPWAI